jgi:hypothetical protein
MELSGKAQIQNTDLTHKENMQTEQRNASLDQTMLAESGKEGSDV